MEFYNYIYHANELCNDSGASSERMLSRKKDRKKIAK